MTGKTKKAIETEELIKRIGNKQVYYTIGYRPKDSYTFTSADVLLNKLGSSSFYFKLTSAMDMIEALEFRFKGNEYCVFRCEEL